MKTRSVLIGILLVLTSVVAISVACDNTRTEPNTTAVPTATPSIYDIDINAIESAVSEYYKDNGQWPTADGQPGDIVWDKLVPTYINSVPATDAKCDWYIDDDPPGEICRHGCSPCGCPGGEACE